MAKYSPEELILKIDYEGGIDAALHYGISPEDVPREIRHEWRYLVRLHEQFDRQWRTVQALLPDEADAYKALDF